MARKRSKRSMGRYIKGNIDENLPLLTLAADTAVEQIFTQIVNERTLISSIDCLWTLAGMTPVAGDGPIMCGVAHSDYSLAEIEEFLESGGTWNEGNLVSQEVGNRKVRRVGTFDVPGAAGESVTLNDGKRIKTKLNWILLQSQSLRVWAYNLGTGALTTGALLDLQGIANLFLK